MTKAIVTGNIEYPLSALSFEGADVRVVSIDGEPAFVGKDVCERLGYGNPTKAMNDHCRGITKRYPLATNGGIQELRILSEADVLRLIVRSKRPEAERFERWVFEEVLPSIRKTGGYNGLAPQIPRTLSEALRLAADQAEQIEVMRPVVAAYDRLARAQGSVCLTDAAKMCQMKPQAFIRYLNAEHWIYRRVGSPAWIGYAEHLDNGDLEHKYTTVQRDDGTEKITTQARVTAQGVTKLCLKLGIPAPAFDKQEAFNATV